MRAVWKAIAYLLLCMPVAPALAGITAFWQPVPITPEAIADDSQLAGMQSWSLVVTNTEGSFYWAGFRGTLPLGQYFYRHPLGTANRPSDADIAANPALAYHTYVASPHDDYPVHNPVPVLGPFPSNEPPTSFGGPLDPAPGVFSVTWGYPWQPVTHPPGMFEILRLTFPIGVLPEIIPESVTNYIAPNQTLPLPTVIPEPAGLLLIAIVAVALSTRVP